MTPHELKKLHESIPVPPELEERVQKALRPRRRPIRFAARTLTACAACAALFALSVNLSPAWAASWEASGISVGMTTPVPLDTAF